MPKGSWENTQAWAGQRWTLSLSASTLCLPGCCPSCRKRPMLIWQEAFDTIPCESTETISSLPGSRRDSSGETLYRLLLTQPFSQQFPRALWVTLKGKERWVRVARRSPPALAMPPHWTAHHSWGGLGLRPLVQGWVWAKIGQDAKAAKGKQKKVPTFMWPLDLVQSLHSTGLYRNSKGTNKLNTLKLVQRGRAGELGHLSVRGFRKNTHTKTTMQNHKEYLII